MVVTLARYASLVDPMGKKDMYIHVFVHQQWDVDNNHYPIHPNTYTFLGLVFRYPKRYRKHPCKKCAMQFVRL